MGVPVSDVKAAETVSAESLLESFKSIDAAERRRHASVLNYWLSIKGDKDVAPIRDLDPLEISDAGPNSLLLELIGGGEDAEIKHRGDALLQHTGHERLSQAPRPSLLACIAGKLAIVAISRNFLAFEDKFSTEAGETRCWITLLPFSSTGVWVDYVYAFATVEGECAVSEEPAVAEPIVEEAAVEEAVDQAVETDEVAVAEEAIVEEAVVEVEETDLPPIVVEDEVVEPVVEDVPETPFAEPVDLDSPADPIEETAEAEEAAIAPEPGFEPELEPEPEAASEKRPGFSKIFEALTGFHGTNVKVEPTLPPAIEEAPEEAEPQPETQEAEPELEPEPEPEILELEATEEAIAEPSPELEVEAVDTVADVPAEPVSHAAEGTLQSKLEEVRAKADEARLAKLRSNLALYEGLGAAYDFALDAEHSPEEYLRLVEAQGLKIQLRSPMTPVVKLAFDGLCDESMIGQLEAVLAWALKQDLPRGTLAERIESAGGIGPLLNGQAEAA